MTATSHHPAHSPIGQMAFVARATQEAGHFAQVSGLPNGFTRHGRPYVALRCHCVADDCPGWAMVHDTPGDRAHFERLFGARGR